MTYEWEGVNFLGGDSYLSAYYDIHISIHTEHILERRGINEKGHAGPNLDLLCVWQSDAAPFCVNHTKLYFDAKHLKKGLNRGWRNFWCPFFQKSFKPDTALIF